MLSRASKYAILSTLYLAEHASKEKKMSVKAIANSINVPSPFLAKLFQQLVKCNIISSTKGPNGGFYLTIENENKTVCDIIEEIDGTNKLDDCFLGLAKCDGNNPCPVHFIVEPFKKKIFGKFRDQTIKEFANEVEAQGSVLFLSGLAVKK